MLSQILGNFHFHLLPLSSFPNLPLSFIIFKPDFGNLRFRPLLLSSFPNLPLGFVIVYSAFGNLRFRPLLLSNSSNLLLNSIIVKLDFGNLHFRPLPLSNFPNFPLIFIIFKCREIPCHPLVQLGSGCTDFQRLPPVLGDSMLDLIVRARALYCLSTTQQWCYAATTQLQCIGHP